MENGGYLYSAAASQVARRDAASVLARFSGRLGWRPENELVLDVGCGRGDVTHALVVPAVASAVAGKAESLRRTEAAARNRAGGGGCGRFFTKKGVSSGEVESGTAMSGIHKGRGAAEGKFAVVGIDDSKESIEHANEAFARNGVLSFAHMEIARELSSKRLTRRFTKIFSFHSLRMTSNNAVFRNLYRLLDANGEMLLALVAKSPLYAAHRKLAKHSRWREYMKDVNADSVLPHMHHTLTDAANAFQRQLEAHGFQVAACEASCGEYDFGSDVTSLVAELRAMPDPFCGSFLRAEERGDYLLDFAAEYVAENRNRVEGGKYTLLVALAKKPAAANSHQPQEERR